MTNICKDEIKIIAVDMDGTFLRKDNTYDIERFIKQYEFMKENNIHFVVASGNQYYQLRSFFPEIMHEITFVAENGAYIVDQNKDLFVAELKDEDVNKVIDAINQYDNILKIVCGKKSAYVLDSIDQKTYDFMNFYYPRLKKVPDFNHFDDQIFKVFLDCHNGDFETILKELKEKIGSIMTPVDCGHEGIDLIIPSMNKAHGIEYLKKYWQLEDYEIMSFGDSGNDYEMLSISKYGFAMSNAKDSIKEVAHYLTDSNDEAGVLNAIDLLIKKTR